MTIPQPEGPFAEPVAWLGSWHNDDGYPGHLFSTTKLEVGEDYDQVQPLYASPFPQPEGMGRLTDEQIDRCAANAAEEMSVRHGGYIMSLAMLREFFDAASALASLPMSTEQESREMFVARLSNGDQDTMMSCRDVLALLDDCDMLALTAVRCLYE